MFMNATSFSRDVYKWKLNNCILTNMFNGAKSITASNLTQGQLRQIGKYLINTLSINNIDAEYLSYH